MRFKILTENLTLKKIKDYFFKSKVKYFSSFGPEGSKEIAQKSMDNFDEEDWEYVLKWFNSLSFPLTVYRGFWGKSKEEINLDKIGISWTPDLSVFTGKSTIGTSKMNIIAEATINENDVDWQSTIDNFMYYSIPGRTQYETHPENEITLKKNAKPQNIILHDRDEIIK